MSDYGIELGLYVYFNNIIDVIKITPKTITVVEGIRKLDNWRMTEETGFTYLVIREGAYPPRQYHIIEKEGTIGIKNNGNTITYFKNSQRRCWEKVPMNEVKFMDELPVDFSAPVVG